MLSIGALSKRTGVKVPTIRYYEQTGLLPPPERTEGGQRRYGRDAEDRLAFIRHARALGFPVEAVAALIDLSSDPDRPCAEASAVAAAQLEDVRARIARLQRLETDLARIVDGCQGKGRAGDCYVLASLSDHGLCEREH